MLPEMGSFDATGDVQCIRWSGPVHANEWPQKGHLCTAVPASINHSISHSQSNIKSQHSVEDVPFELEVAQTQVDSTTTLRFAHRQHITLHEAM